MNNVKLGFLAIANQDYQEAVNIFRRALESNKEADTFFGFGLAHYQLGDLPTARWAFYQALERNKDHKEAQGYIGRIEHIQQQKKLEPVLKRKSLFRAVIDHLEINDGSWGKFFVKGVNIGVGLPGYFPGEFAVKKGTYLKWFNQISELGANAVRVYTILPPDFYEGLCQFNSSGKKLYLFQEIWTELPAGNDFRNSKFLEGLLSEIKNAVDVVYGNAALPEQRGHAHGKYAYDVSPYLAGFIIGREWEGSAVRGFNELHQRNIRDYQGSFLSIRQGNPFEVWITETCDFLQSYEQERYRVTHPVTTVNWPTLDPIEHPSESTYEDEYRVQGLGSKDLSANAHMEDVESLDLAKINRVKGNGFFALYHVYPYHPDFMNHDYLDQENPYLSYLSALKLHHGHQPVLIAEFGVPTSRESAHWHTAGWNHGGHGDREQGEINGKLMRTIHQTGMAGGILFSWFDEWFKKNWLFQSAELPAERKPLWFNFQDPEENYGLLAMYPGYPSKKVSLACRAGDWNGIAALYEKKDDAVTFRFNDGFDDTRRLVRLSAQHDEGFLYLLLETAGPIDFSKSNFLIGLDTCVSDAGERLLPFGTDVRSPVGLTFVVHLAGKERSRILAAKSYDKYLNGNSGRIRPEASDQGAWVMMQNETNIRRVSKNGKRFFPAHIAMMSRLRFGSLDVNKHDYHSLADFFCRDNRVELRIPWGLINVTDPSSRTVLWTDDNSVVRTTAGIRMLAVSYRPVEGGLVAQRTGLQSNQTDDLPYRLADTRIRTYSWDGWDTPLFHTYRKESYHHYQKILQAIPEAR